MASSSPRKTERLQRPGAAREFLCQPVRGSLKHRPLAMKLGMLKPVALATSIAIFAAGCAEHDAR